MSPDPSAVRRAVIEVMQETKGVLDDAGRAARLFGTGDLRLDELEVDSLDRLEMIMRLEERLGIEIDDDELTAQDTLNGLVSFLEARVARSGG